MNPPPNTKKWDLSRRDIPTIAQRFSVGFRVESCSRPEGTDESRPSTLIDRPFGTEPHRQPKAKALGYSHMSLRDKRFGLKWGFPKGLAPAGFGFGPLRSRGGGLRRGAGSSLSALARPCLGLVLCVMVLGLAGCHQTPGPRFEPLSATGFPLWPSETNAVTPTATNSVALTATNMVTPYATNILQEGDTLSITFLYSTNFNAVQKVGLDGLINLDQVGQVKAAGRTVTNLEAELTRLYRPHVKEDSITVRLAAAAASVYVSGAVVRPGRVAMDRPMTALEGIMEAGGFDPYRARMKVVMVSRLENGKQRTYRLNLKRALEGRDPKPFYLQPFDILYVPTKTINF